MFAVIKTGGKQYKVAKDDVLVIEKLAADAGDTVQFNEILMVGGTIGAPTVEDAAVQAEVLEQGRGPKILNFKKRRRKHSSKRLKGHRQYLTTVRVTDILESGAGKTGVKAALGAASVGAIAAAAPSAPAAKSKEPAVKTEAKAAPAGDVEAVRPSNLLTEAQGDADDLTKISGVGPKLNEKLNENGVFHFWQIAQWGPAEIAFMDDQLSFKGRIERDEWISQAEKFSADKDK